MLKEIIIIAATIYGEAGGESYLTKKSVADTIHYEMQISGKSVIETCTNPKRYSCWQNKIKMQKLKSEMNDISVNTNISISTNKYTKEWLNCLKLAEDIASDNYIRSYSWTHFYNPKMSNPYWSKHLIATKTIGNLRFGVYKEK